MQRIASILMLLALTSGSITLCMAMRPFDDTLPEAEECLIDGKIHTSADYSVDYKGRKIYLCSNECVAQYRELQHAGHLDSVTAKIEPRSALFQEDSNPRRQLSNFYLFGGLYVLAGLLCGGLASYLAVEKGLPGWPAFALGLAFNLIGLAILWAKPKQDMPFPSKGLTKIPTTRAEFICEACGHANHPSATSCNGCSAKLTPQAPSEVSLAGLRKEV